MRILTVAGNTFRENIRDKILYNLILFALIMILSSIVLGQLTLGYEDKVIMDLGLSAISIFGTLIAIFIGIGLVYKEIEKRTVYALLAKPIRRHEFILGKFLGLVITLFVNVVIMTAGLILTLSWRGSLSAAGIVRLLPVVCVIFLSLALTTALSLLFSTFSTPALSALFTFFLWVTGHFNRDLIEFGKLTKSAPMQWVCKTLYFVLPNFGNFSVVGGQNVIQRAAYFQPLDPTAVLWVAAYAVLYCGILLFAAIAIFARRDFK